MAFPKRISIEKFSATDGVLLYGLLALPKRSRKKAVVIHVHGLTGNFYGSAAVSELARAITSKGYAFFSIQTRGSYIIERFSKVKGRKATSLTAGAALERFEDSVYDIEGAIRFMASKGYRKVVLEGHSTGCQKILYYHSRRRSRAVRGLVLLAPADDYNFNRAVFGRKLGKLVAAARRQGRKRGALMPPELMPLGTIIGANRFLSTAEPKRPESQILNYAADRMRYIAGVRVPALAAIGTDDMYINGAGLSAGKAAEILKRNSKRIETVVINGADHGFHGRRRKLVNAVAKWISRNV